MPLVKILGLGPEQPSHFGRLRTFGARRSGVGVTGCVQLRLCQAPFVGSIGHHIRLARVTVNRLHRALRRAEVLRPNA